MPRSAHLITAALVAFATATAALPAMAADLDGRWRTAQGDGLVEFAPCGSSVCGYLVEGSADQPRHGALLINRLMAAAGSWRGGRIIDPSSGRTYAGEVRRLDAGRLQVTGCLVRPLCASQIWKRAQ